jgi:glycerol-3-phosphate acyltransferase PlsY
MFYQQKPRAYAWAALIITIFIWLKHIPNIQRLLQGEENKVGG